MASMIEQLNAKRMTISQTARAANVNPSTVWRWITSGVRGHCLRCVALGGRRFVLESDLEGFLISINGGDSSPAPVASDATPGGDKLRAAKLTRSNPAA